MDIDMTTIVDVNLLSVERRGNIIEVQREMVFADGSAIKGKHAFPADTLEWRAAEYGIDPADLDTLLDIVIHEPFLPEPDQPDLMLYDAPTIEDARNYHLGRIRAVQAKSKMGQRGGPDLVREKIKGMAVVNPEAVGLKREYVGRGRERYQQAREAQAKAGLRALFVDPSVTEEERLAKLRNKLIADRPTATTKGKNDG